MPFPYLRAYRWPKSLDWWGRLKYATKEQPVAVASVGVFILTMFYHIERVIHYQNINSDVKRYKMSYTVYRPDDPRIKLIKE